MKASLLTIAVIGKIMCLYKESGFYRDKQFNTVYYSREINMMKISPLHSCPRSSSFRGKLMEVK